LPDPHVGRAVRLQGYMRFYALPGSRFLRMKLDRVQIAHKAVRSAYYANDNEWSSAKREYFDAVEEFEIALHALLTAGRPPRDRGKPVGLNSRNVSV
jgi:hypothetical protein